MPPAIVVRSSVPSWLSTSSSTRAAMSATAAAGSVPRADPASRPRAAPAAAAAAAPAPRDRGVGGGRPRRTEVVHGRSELGGRGRTGEVGLDRQQGTARVADEGADVPLAQAGPVPPVTDERGRADEP